MLIIQRPTVEAIDEEEGNRQRFAIGPLDPGFGHTLGNSLRRTLLSSIPGAAVTQVRFDDALHEFTYLQGVKEDVSDIILNLKDLVLTSESDEPVTLRVDVRGPADVTGADLKATSDVEVLNPDLHLATVNAKGRLAMDVTIERGKGYVSAERNKRVGDDRRDPRRLDLLAGAAGLVHRRADAASSSRPTSTACPRHRDRRFDHAPRRARLRRPDASHRSSRLVAELSEDARGPRARRRRYDDLRLARPRPADRGPRPLRAPPQLPEAGADQHDRRAHRAHARRPARRSPTSARSRLDEVHRSASTSGASSCAGRTATDARHPEEGRAASAATPPTRRRCSATSSRR